MSLHFSPTSKQLKVVFGQGTVDTYDQIEGIPVEPQIDLTLTAGRFGKDRCGTCFKQKKVGYNK